MYCPNSQKYIIIPIIFAVIIAIYDISIFKIEFLGGDSAQYLSTARNILRGNGIKTNILYYEEQRNGSIPAPQTIWPPGFPFLVSLSMLLGVNDIFATFYTALFFQLVGILIFFYLLRKVGLSPPFAVAAVISWQLFAPVNRMILIGYSESAFTTMTLLATYIFQKGLLNAKNSYRLMLWAGIFAAISFCIRYAGIAFIASLFFFLLLYKLKYRKTFTLKSILYFLVFPLSTVSIIFLRNYLLVGTFTGGPRIDQGDKFLRIFIKLRYIISDIFGIASNKFLSTIFVVGLACCIMIIILVCCKSLLSHYLNFDFSKNNFHQNFTELSSFFSKPQFNIFLISAIYIIVTFILIIHFALSTSIGFFSPRYITPLAPYFILCFFLLIHSAWPHHSTFQKSLFITALSVSLALYVTTQSISIIKMRESHKSYRAYNHHLVSALQQRVVDTTLHEFLKQHVNDNSPILTIKGQFLGMFLDKTTIGLTPEVYTDRIWDEGSVKELIVAHTVPILCLFPSAYRNESQKYSNRPFVSKLLAGKAPNWLKPIISNENILVYEVDYEKLVLSLPQSYGAD